MRGRTEYGGLATSRVVSAYSLGFGPAVTILFLPHITPKETLLGEDGHAEGRLSGPELRNPACREPTMP